MGKFQDKEGVSPGLGQIPDHAWGGAMSVLGQISGQGRGFCSLQTVSPLSNFVVKGLQMHESGIQQATIFHLHPAICLFI